jgi:hypothetical protein
MIRCMGASFNWLHEKCQGAISSDLAGFKKFLIVSSIRLGGWYFWSSGFVRLVGLLGMGGDWLSGDWFAWCFYCCLRWIVFD